jgi:hypothetical protein
MTRGRSDRTNRVTRERSQASSIVGDQAAGDGFWPIQVEDARRLRADEDASSNGLAVGDLGGIGLGVDRDGSFGRCAEGRLGWKEERMVSMVSTQLTCLSIASSELPPSTPPSC